MSKGVLFCSDEFVEFVTGDSTPEDFAGFVSDSLQVFVSPQAMLGPTVMAILEGYGDALHFPEIWIL